MTSNDTCEACGGTLSPWVLDKGNTLARCLSCGHLTRSLYDAPAAQREHAWGGVGAFDHLRTALTWRSQQRFLKKLSLQRQPRLLEIGFGAGLMLRRHLNRGSQCAGVEAHLLETPLSAGVVEAIDYQSCSAEEMEFAPESFDLIYAIHVAEHLNDPRLVFEKIYRTLAPSGALHLLTPNGASDGLKLFKSAWWNLEDPTHLRFFTPESITRLLSSVGFVEIEVRQPLWDSLLLEGSSGARKLFGNLGSHGVLSQKRGKFFALATAPLFLLARALRPNLNPSIEIFARKGPSVR